MRCFNKKMTVDFLTFSGSCWLPVIINKSIQRPWHKIWTTLEFALRYHNFRVYNSKFLAKTSTFIRRLATAWGIWHEILVRKFLGEKIFPVLWRTNLILSTPEISLFMTFDQNPTSMKVLHDWTRIVCAQNSLLNAHCLTQTTNKTVLPQPKLEINWISDVLAGEKDGQTKLIGLLAFIWPFKRRFVWNLNA